MHRGSRSALAFAAAVCEALETRQLLSSVTGAYLFYNNSAFDGNNAAINASDDAAIATDKAPLRELQKANFGNYSSYSRGLNGLMIDIASPNGTPTLTDFSFRAGNNTSDPFQWSAAPAPTGFAVRKGAGLNGADRFEFTWSDTSAVKGKWLQATVIPNVRTGIFVRETLYFGSAIGDTGNNASSAGVDAADQLKVRANQTNQTLSATGSALNPYDLNRDRRVDAADQLIALANQTSSANELTLITTPANPISDLAAETLGSQEVRLIWQAHLRVETGYSVQMAVGEDAQFHEMGLAPAGATSYLVTDAAAGSRIRFRVVPIAAGTGSLGPILFVTTPGGLTAEGTNSWYTVSLPSVVPE